MDPDLRFFLDRGLGSRLVVDGLRRAGWICTTMDERYGALHSQSVADVDWIRDASGAKEVLLGKDKAMARKPLEAEALYYNEARLFVVASSRITGDQMLDRFLKNAGAIERMARQPGPFAFGIYEDRIARLRLNFP